MASKWKEWRWRVVKDPFDCLEPDTFIEEGFIKSPSLKNARMRALQDSTKTQNWWQGEWKEQTIGKIMQPQSVVCLQVYRDYEKENVLILEEIKK